MLYSILPEDSAVWFWKMLFQSSPTNFFMIASSHHASGLKMTFDCRCHCFFFAGFICNPLPQKIRRDGIGSTLPSTKMVNWTVH